MTKAANGDRRDVSFDVSIQLGSRMHKEGEMLQCEHDAVRASYGVLLGFVP